MGKPLSRFCECDICDKEVLALKSVLPHKWVTLWDPAYTMCDTCTQKWIDKYKEFPKYYITGGGWDEFEFPEDSTHWRQADFKFV